MKKWIFDIRSRTFFLLSLVLIILSVLVYTEITSQFDESVILFFQSIAGNPILDFTMWVITEMGGIFTIMIFSFVLFIPRKTRRIGLVMIIAILLGTVASGYLKDYVIGRDRPNLEFNGMDFPIEIERDTSVLGGTGSFPSGHVTRASVLAFVIGFALSERFPRGWCLIWFFPFLVGISRIYVLQHFPMDIFGGIILGILVSNFLTKKLKIS